MAGDLTCKVCDNLFRLGRLFRKSIQSKSRCFNAGNRVAWARRAKQGLSTHPDLQPSTVEYIYSIEECDVSETRRCSLEKYRELRKDCLQRLRGPSVFPVSRQLSKLAWHTAVFQTLNEARRLEPSAPANGPGWNLLSEGYANLMSVGIRRLLDKDKRSISLAWVVNKLKRNRHLLTREFFVSYDGLPYEYETCRERYYAAMNINERAGTCFRPVHGPEAWEMAEIMHEAFDRVCGNPSRRNRSDTISESIILSLEGVLSSSSITLVERFATKVIAHADMIGPGQEKVSFPAHEDVLDALAVITGLAHYISTVIFYDANLGDVVPFYDGDPVEALDQPWISSKNLAKLRAFWENLSGAMNQWASEEKIGELLDSSMQDLSADDAPP